MANTHYSTSKKRKTICNINSWQLKKGLPTYINQKTPFLSPKGI